MGSLVNKNSAGAPLTRIDGATSVPPKSADGMAGERAICCRSCCGSAASGEGPASGVVRAPRVVPTQSGAAVAGASAEGGVAASGAVTGGGAASAAGGASDFGRGWGISCSVAGGSRVHLRLQFRPAVKESGTQQQQQNGDDHEHRARAPLVQYGTG